MSNRALKLQLYAKNPHCHYCGCHMILTNVKNVTADNPLPPNAATIEHIVSRFHPHRWVKKKKGQHRRVLACLQCNQKKSHQEILSLSRADVLRRCRGFSLSPKGKPKIIKPLKSINQVKKVLYG